MQLPRNAREKEKVEAYIRGQKNVPGFESLMAWFRSELQEKDEQNRLTGFENTTSEAKCLADFIKIVAACQTPETDRDTSSSGVESRSAAILM